VGLFLALLAALGARYLRLLRQGDEHLARLGALGLSILVAFVVKNLTDDFFFRANLKLFFAVNALLLGASALRLRQESLSGPEAGHVDASRSRPFVPFRRKSSGFATDFRDDRPGRK
jgi:hypothetical protein